MNFVSDSARKTLLGLGVALFATSGAVAADNNTVNVAIAMGAGAENAWSAALLNSFKNVQKEAPDGLKLTFKYTENVMSDTAVSVLRGYAESGKYDIVWGNSTFTDEVDSIKGKYPNTLFVVAGGGNRATGGNMYWLDAHLHESAYVAGVFAGLMSKSHVIGVVGLFPSDNVNDKINAFREGARSVAKDTKMKVTFIESWYDPVKAAEATNAQASAGADVIFQSGESFQVCEQRKILCIGEYLDQSRLSPASVPLSVLVNWEPAIKYLINEVKKHKSSGQPYDAPKESKWFTMAQGGTSLTGFGQFDSKIPDQVKQAVKKTQEDIVSGKLQIKRDPATPVSD